MSLACPNTKRPEESDQDSNPRPIKMPRTEIDDLSDTILFTSLDGRKLCHRGVGTSPEPEDPGKRDVFTKLPNAIITTIFEDACLPEPLAVLRRDRMHTAWPADDDVKSFENAINNRVTTLVRLKSVCRLFRHIATPLSHTHTIGYLNKPAPDVQKWMQSVMPTVEGDADGSDCSEVGSSNPTSSRIVSEICSALKNTLGTHIRALMFKGTTIDSETALATWGAFAPQLETIVFSSKTESLSDQNIRDLSRNISPAIQHICGLSLSRNGSTTVDNVLGLLNYASSLKTLSVRNLTLSAQSSSRLLFIFRLNARLAAQAGRESVGVTTLTFGHGSNISRTFLEGLHEATPHLKHLHLLPGCLFNDETANSGNAGTEFDVAALLSKVGCRLESLTLVCTTALRVKGTMEELTLRCPNMRAAHIRADVIAFSFFRRVLASVTPTDSDSIMAESTTTDSSEIPSSPPAKKACALTYLRLHHSYSNSAPHNVEHYIELDSRDSIIQYAKAAADAEDSGIQWPASEGSQKGSFDAVGLVNEGESPAVHSGEPPITNFSLRGDER